MAVTHGKKSTYTGAGCRCDLCREAWAANRRELYKQRREACARGEALPAHVKHGRRSTYINWGCRCAECKASAAAESQQRSRATHKRAA